MLRVPHLDDADSFLREQVSVPPLFAEAMRDEIAARIEDALSAGDHEKAAVLLHEAATSFPEDATFKLLQNRCARLAQRKAQFEAALHEAMDELSEYRWVAAAGKFREALSLSYGIDLFARKVFETATALAEKQAEHNWRFFESLLDELSVAAGYRIGSRIVWSTIDSKKREEIVGVALEESGRAEHTAYLPHLRNRLAELAKTYPQTADLDSRLKVLDALVAQCWVDDRETNLRRLILFRDRLDLAAEPETLRGFSDLVAPFVDPYRNDEDFVAVLRDVRDLRSKYESAALLVSENRLQDAQLICEQVLQRRPKNVLFCAMEEQAKSREWVVRRVASITQRARAFEQNAQYAEALEEWGSLREIDPRHPGLDSEIQHCAALKEQSAQVPVFQPEHLDEQAITPEVVVLAAEPVLEAPPEEARPFTLAAPASRARFRVVITGEAWNNLKTGVAATFAVLLVVLVFASSGRH